MVGAVDYRCRPESSAVDPLGLARGPGRARLAAAGAALAAATPALAEAQQRASRLSAAIAAAARFETELAALRAADEARLGDWLAASGGNEPRPQPNPAILGADHSLTRLSEDAAAARAALPAAEQAFRHCAETVRALQRQRDDAICTAAVEAAHAFAESYRAALSAALEQEARLRGLRDELLLRGNRAEAPPGALSAAAQIGELISTTRRAAAVQRNPEAGRDLIEALAADPDACL
jgi:hypothetical protein